MIYKVKYHKRVLKKLSKLDIKQSKLIIAWIEKNLVDTRNPRIFGKQLQGNLSEYWRYRIGNYRLIARIIDDEILIELVDIGHRRDIYKTKS